MLLTEIAKVFIQVSILIVRGSIALDEALIKYRDELLNTLRFLNESYDKMLVTLSGGALGLSIVFLRDVVNVENVVHSELLLLSWSAFILSLASVLGRIMFGIEAYRYAIKQVDDGTIYDKKPGGSFSLFSRVLHIAAASFLLVGLLLIAIFSYLNLGG
jgi:hypothetical protein